MVISSCCSLSHVPPTDTPSLTPHSHPHPSHTPQAFLKKLFRKRGGSRDSPREAASPAPEIPDSFLLHFASSAGQHAGFGAAETAHNGLPVDCRCIAYDPVQRLVAVGSKTGIVKVYGAEGIEMTLAPVEVGDSNNEDVAFLVFIPSQHRLLAVQANSAVNIWDMRFQRQCGYLHNQWTSCRVTCAFYAPQSHYHYLYLSTDDGVVHVLDTQGCALTAYRIRAVEDLGLSDEIPETGEPAEVVALVPNPVDATRLLIAFAHAGVALWDVPKRKVVHWFKYERPTLCDAHDPDSDEPFAIRCVTWHNSGTQILAGCESGYFVHWHNETKGCEKGVVHWVDGTASAATLCSPISHIEWALTPNVDTDVGCIVVAGGSKMHDDPLHADPHGIGILWLDAHSVASVAKKGGLTWSAEHARSIILPTANGGAVADFNLAYPQGSGPGYGPGFPSAAVVLTGGDGTAVRVWLHPLPSVKGAWPPIAAARPMPLPPPMPMPPLLHCRSLSASAPSTTPPITCIALLPAVPSDELGAAFNDVLRAKNRWKTLPMPKMYPEWKWPVDGGAMENSPPFFDVAGNLLNAAEVKRTIEEVSCGVQHRERESLRFSLTPGSLFARFVSLLPLSACYLSLSPSLSLSLRFVFSRSHAQAGRDDERENEGKLAPQVQTIITGHADGTVCFWDVSAPLQTRACASAPLRLVHELRIFLTSCLEGDAPDPPSISCAHCDPDSGLLALGFPSGEIIVFRLSGTMGFEEVWRTSVHAPNEIKKIVLAPEANRMVSIDVNGCVQMSHLPFDIAEEEEEEEEEETTSKGGGTEERGDVAGGEDEGPPPTPPRQKEEEEEGGPPTPPRRFENAALCASSASSISLCALPASTWTGRSPSPLASRSASPRSPSPRVPATPGSPDAAGGGGKISPTVAVGGTLGTIDFYSFSNGRALGTLSASDLEVGAGGVHFIFPIACTGEPQPLLSSSMPETAVGEAAPTLVVVGIGATVALLAIELPSEASLADGNLRMLPASLAKKAFDAEIVSASIVSIGASSWCVLFFSFSSHHHRRRFYCVSLSLSLSLSGE